MHKPLLRHFLSKTSPSSAPANLFLTGVYIHLVHITKFFVYYVYVSFRKILYRTCITKKFVYHPEV